MSKEKSLKQILGDLTPTQIWGVLAAVITILSTTFALGTRLSPMLGTAHTSQENLVPCFKAPGYPIRDWTVSGDITLGPKTMLAPKIKFVTPTNGTILTNEKLGVAGSFIFDRVPAPNQQVRYTVTDGTGYKAEMPAGLVSVSGCPIEGTWSDNRDHSGNMTLFWYQPKEFWVKGSAQ